MTAQVHFYFLLFNFVLCCMIDFDSLLNMTLFKVGNDQKRLTTTELDNNRQDRLDQQQLKVNSLENTFRISEKSPLLMFSETKPNLRSQKQQVCRDFFLRKNFKGQCFVRCDATVARTYALNTQQCAVFVTFTHTFTGEEALLRRLC